MMRFFFLAVGLGALGCPAAHTAEPDAGPSDGSLDASDGATDAAVDAPHDADAQCAACDDGVYCTLDVCVDGGCLHLPRHELCGGDGLCRTSTCTEEGCLHEDVPNDTPCREAGGTCCNGGCTLQSCTSSHPLWACHERVWRACDEDTCLASDPRPDGAECPLADGGTGACLAGDCVPP